MKITSVAGENSSKALGSVFDEIRFDIKSVNREGEPLDVQKMLGGYIVIDETLSPPAAIFIIWITGNVFRNSLATRSIV